MNGYRHALSRSERKTQFALANPCNNPYKNFADAAEWVSRAEAVWGEIFDIEATKEGYNVVQVKFGR